MIYHTFAQLYDQLFDDELYQKWAAYTMANGGQDAQQHRDRAGTVSGWHGDGKECKDEAQNGANERQRGKKPELIKAKKRHVFAPYCATVNMR